MGRLRVVKRIGLVLALGLFASCHGCADGERRSFFLSKQPIRPATSPLAKASAAARPAWADTLHDPSNGFAPQAGVPAIWEKAVPAGTLSAPEKGLLICRVKYDGETDPQALIASAKEPDLALLIDVAGKGELRAQGPDDARIAWFTVPQPELVAGDVLRVEFYDRNYGNFSDQPLGALSLTWNGSVPVLADDGLRSVTCSWVAPAALAELADSEAQAVDRALGVISAEPLLHPLVPGRESWTSRWNGMLDDADWRIARMAGLVGWAQPQVRQRVAARQAAHDAKYAAGRKLVEEKRATLPPGVPSRGRSLEVLATGIDCTKRPDDNDDQGCHIVLDVVGLEKPLDMNYTTGFLRTRFTVLFADGSAIDNEKLQWEVRKGNRLGDDHSWEGQAEKGMHLVVAVTMKPALRHTGPQPSLLLVSEESGGVLLVRVP